jgi:PKD repeat protein
MKKKWVIIIAVVVLLASFTIYQYVHREPHMVDLIQAQMAANSGSETIDRAAVEKALGLDKPFYTQIFSNLAVPAAQNYPADYNPTSYSTTNSVASLTTTMAPAPDTSINTGISQPMIVRTANISIAVNDITSTITTITRLANDNTGYVVSAVQNSNDNSVAGIISIRVPAVQFESVMTLLRKMAVKITSESVSANDVSQEYTDLSAKLRNSETAEAQLTEIMSKAEKVEDVLAIHNQLTATQQDIEVTKGRMQYLEQTSAMSLITINLQQSSLTINLYAGTSYARTNDNIGFKVDIQGGISPFSYQWDFGDGTTSLDAEAWHKYNASGNYSVAVTVTDDKGNQAVNKRTNYITISPGWSPHDIFDGAWRGLISFLRFLFVLLIWVLMFSPIIIVIALVWYFSRRNWKRKKAKVS